MKFISWNIDSLNAALTANSARAILSRDVLNTIIKYCKNKIEQILLTVADDNKVAIHLYEKFGFQTFCHATKNADCKIWIGFFLIFKLRKSHSYRLFRFFTNGTSV